MAKIGTRGRDQTKREKARANSGNLRAVADRFKPWREPGLAGEGGSIKTLAARIRTAITKRLKVGIGMSERIERKHAARSAP